MSTWPPCAMLYDGSFAGFLTCVGESFRQKVYPFYFLSPGVEQISLYPILETPTDQALAKSVYRSLEETVSSTFRRLITYSFLTCLPQRERTMLLTRAIQHLTHEAHQLKGFVRFADYGGVLVGQIAPKNRVLPLLRPHFCQRLPEEAFLLHDKTHREGLFYADRKWKIRPVDHLDLDRPDQAELQCQALWRRFYQTIAIPARHNPKCRMSHMPKRYWDNLPEMQPDPMSTPQ